MSEKLHHVYPHNAPTLEEKEIYPLRWDTSTTSTPDISGLPSFDYSVYLFSTVEFHLGQSYRLFDKNQFLKRLRDFYHGDPSLIVNQDRLWFVQFLLMVSIGTALLSRSKSDQPPGSKFFVRAMSLMPDHASLWRDSLLAIEVLAIAALYLYSIDQRESAYIYLGQAIRIAQFEGLHTQLPEEQLGLEVVARCRNLWWTLYIMDRHFSYSVGLPMTTTDSEISASIDPPSTCLTEDVALTLQAKLSRLMSFILTSVYKSERATLGAFLDTTRSILETLAGYAQEVENIIHLKFRNSVDTMPSGTQHITLLYHQCVIVATRPLLLSALMERLENLDNEREDWQEFLALTKTLISTGIKSAAKTLQILSGDDGLVEFFLLYNLEFAYAAAIQLAMANALFPEVDNEQCFIQQSHSILDRMITNGNQIAEARREELMYLENLFQELSSRAVSQGLQPLTLDTPDDAETTTEDRTDDRNGALLDEMEGPISLDDPLWMSYSASDSQALCPADMEVPSVELLSNIGISSADFLSIVDQIGNLDASYGVLDYGPRNDGG
ncbi:Transcription factor, fungi [Penicillium italicum]|uniref:Transcription factor, fungi n=1 Tax=Penicillium italicum TaxID=40296 RepID=A0A0A2KDM2_PENIT|nr:Transcription factor, fungi [Penicillium italicum]